VKEYFEKFQNNKKEGVIHILPLQALRLYPNYFSSSVFLMKALKSSMGIGKSIVLFFSLAISDTVES